MRRLFVPTARQLNFVIAAGLLSLGYAMYLRYMAIELSQVGIACQAGLRTWLCWLRSLTIVVFQNSGFGVVALASAALQFIRPSIYLFTFSVAATAFGLVLYNLGLSSLAAGVLILSLARPSRGGAQGQV